jgi:EmrB/QacA subfamily drug resistance transporter
MPSRENVTTEEAPFIVPVESRTGAKNVNTSTYTSNKALVLLVIVCSYLMIVLDISIVIAALPRMQLDLGFTATGLSWVQNAYILAFGGLLLLGARAGDILGRRRMFISGLVVFTVSSLAIGLAQSAGMLIVFRAVQGAGAAILAPSTLALLTTIFAEGSERTRAVSLYGAVAGLGASVGLVLGGVFTDWLSWRVGFLINVPLGIALIFGARRFIAESERRSGSFDALGALTSSLGMTALVYGIVRSARGVWSDPVTVGMMSGGIVLLALLVLNESRARQPIMPLHLFAHRERLGAYLGRFLFLGAMVGFWFFCAQYLQRVLGFSAAKAGLAFLPVTIPNFVSALNVPRLTRRLGNAGLMIGGLFVSLVGMFWLSRVGAHACYLSEVALPMILIGIGQGATLSPLTVSGVAGVSRDDAGAASGVINVAHQLGGSMGLAVQVVLFAAAGGAAGSSEALTHGIGAALTGSTAMLALALVLTVTLIGRPHAARIRVSA